MIVAQNARIPSQLNPRATHAADLSLVLVICGRGQPTMTKSLIPPQWKLVPVHARKRVVVATVLLDLGQFLREHGHALPAEEQPPTSKEPVEVI
jgi:hypothetical protein